MATLAVEMTSDEAKLLRGMQRVIDQQAKLQAGLKKTGDEARKAGDAASVSQQRMGSSEDVAEITKLATGWLSVQAAISFATDALRAHNEERKRGIDSVEGLDDENRNLVQVSKSSTHFMELQGLADTLSQTHGVARDRTRRLLFAAESEGFQQYAADAARFDPVVSMESQARTAGQVPTLFNGQITAREGTAMALAASEFSRLDFDPFSQSLPQAAQGGVAAGSSPEETFALLSVLAGKFRSGDTAADRIKSLGVKMSLDDRFKGMGIVEGVKRMQSDPELRTDFAKDSIELNEAINSIASVLPEVERQTIAIADERGKVGTDEDILERKLRMKLSDPRFVQLQKKRAAEIRKEIATENAFALDAGENAETRAEIDALLIEGGADPFQKHTARQAADYAEGFGLSGKSISNAAAAGEFAGGLTIPGQVGKITDYAGDGERVGLFEGLTPVGMMKQMVQATNELLGVNKQQLGAMKGNGAAQANAQAGRHAE